MKYHLKHIGLCLLSLWFAACAHEEETPSPQTSPGIAVSVGAMELKGDLQTRALFPLGPEKENMIRKLSLLVFDDEGQHYIGNFDYYRYFPVADEESPNGKQTVYESEYGGNLPGRGTLCAVANISQEDLLDALRNKASEGGGSNVISLQQFKELTVDLPYIENADSVGLVKEIYMFGYYAGELKPYPGGNRDITISLGRIITRLEVSLSVDEEVEKEAFSYAIRLGNTSREAYIFPGERSPEEMFTDGYFHPVQLTQAPVNYHYYVGPHSATTEDEATFIEIAYGKALKDGVLDVNDPSTKMKQVALCNDPPGTEGRNYWLNRNSVYQISIRLVGKKNNDSESSPTRSTVEPGVYQVEVE